MQVRAHTLSRSVACGVAVLCAVVFVASAASTAHAAGVVGTGSAASCTDAALDAALTGGGLVTFSCGTAPVTIDISTGTGTKTIAVDTTIDGGGLITISGGEVAQVFVVAYGVNFTVQNLTIANGAGAINSGNGTLTVTNCTFTGNSPGGIVNSHGMLSIVNSTFNGNSGFGIANGGTLTVTNSTFTGNSASGITTGGGTLTVTDSSFSDNSAPYGGGILVENGTLTVANSTFSDNSALGGGGIEALSDYDADGYPGVVTLTVANSTFTGNSASKDGGAIDSEAVGILSITNSTFINNSAPIGGGISVHLIPDYSPTFRRELTAPAFRRELTAPDFQFLLRNTIVANNAGGNCSIDSGLTIEDDGHNLDDGMSCGFSAANGSLSNTDPQLDPAGLQNNGGPTQTVALCTGPGMPAGCTAASPAIGMGNGFVCAEAPVNDRDQRGFVRPGTGHTVCSMGAYEADASAPEPCMGDCNGNGLVAINELVLGVNIVLGVEPETACPAFANSLELVDIAQLITGVNNALTGCAVPSPIRCVGGTADGGCQGI